MILGWTGTGTLGGPGGNDTLGDGGGTARTADSGGTTMGSAGFAMVLSNISTRSTMAFCWASPNWANGATGAGLVRASINACAATMSVLTEEVFGTGYWRENVFTILVARLALVFRTKTR